MRRDLHIQSMPPAIPDCKEFDGKRQKYEYWLTDPILRPEALEWAKRNGYVDVDGRLVEAEDA